jgi:hypothetical protein
MLVGIILMSISYLMVPPWSFVFPEKLWVILLALPVMGLGQAMIYSNFYIVPNFPHMIRSANEDYGYTKDDILIDNISCFANSAFNVGTILGLVFQGFLDKESEFQTICALISIFTVFYAFLYCLGSGIAKEWIHGRIYKYDNL